MKKILMAAAMLLSLQASAQNWVEVDDASKLLWQMQADGVVWFRNLNEFSASQAPCCYAYKLDTTTPGGRVIWSVIMTKMAAHERITLGFPDIGSNVNVQTLNYLGRHEHSPSP